MNGAQGPAKMLGMYQVGPFLGAGPVGDVFRAHQPGQESRELAIKVIRSAFSQAAPVRTRFNTIVTAVQRLDHPHILPLEAAGEQNGQLYSVMPLVVQGSMLARLARGRLSPKDIAPLFKQICDALSYAHSQGVMHGNLKPANVMLFEGRHVLLADFGLLWNPLEMNLAQNGLNPEALTYLAPEQADGAYDVRSDIYSLGVMLFQALTGNVPFTGRTPFEVLSRHQRQAPPQLVQVNPPLPQGALVFDEVLRMALAKDPDARFQSPIAMARAIVEAGNLANDLPSRIMPALRPNMAPPGPLMLMPPRQAFPGAGPRSMPLQQARPLGPPNMPPQMGPPSAPWPQGPQQQPPSRPYGPGPGYPMPGQMPPGMTPNGQMPPPPGAMRPPMPDDPLAWLLPDGSGPVPPSNRPPSRPINPEMADFLTARRAAPDVPVEGTLRIQGIDAPVPGETGASAKVDAWDDDSPSTYSREYSREYTGARSDVRDRDWDDRYDQSRSMAVPAQRRPSRPTDRWDDTSYTGRSPARRRRDDDDYDESRELRGARSDRPSRPHRRVSAPYDDDRSGQRPAARRRPPSRKAPPPPPPKKPSRLPGILSALVIVALLANGVLLVLFAPDKCPSNACAGLHSKLAQALHLSTPAPAPSLAAQVGSVTLTAYPGATVPVQDVVTLSDASAGTANWSAVSDLPWVTLTPASGQITTAQPVKLSVQLAPDATVKPAAYQANVTITAGGGNTVVQLPITITAPPKLSLAQTALHFTSCGVAQTDTLTNSGGAALTGLKVSTSDSAVTASVSATSIDPSKTATLTVKISCSATSNSYVVYLVSTAGNASLPITYG